MAPASVTPLEQTLIGGIAGVVEVSVMQPTVSVKNALQEGRPLPRTPLGLYRGYAVNAGAFFPITACQFGVNSLLERRFAAAAGAPPGRAAATGIAAAAGAASALISSPAEYLMVQQQSLGVPLRQALRVNVGAYGLATLYKGMGGTLIRDSLYVGAYLGLAPMLRERLEAAPAVAALPGGPALGSGLLAGLACTLATQPADTVKTRMQAFPNRETHPQYRSFASTTAAVVAEGGVAALWAGLLPRGFRILGAVFILNAVRNTLFDAVDARRAAEAAAAADVAAAFGSQH